MICVKCKWKALNGTRAQVKDISPTRILKVATERAKNANIQLEPTPTAPKQSPSAKTSITKCTPDEALTLFYDLDLTKDSYIRLK